MARSIIYHIPVCPYSQRVEILLALKGLSDAAEFHVIDITEPRPDWFLEKTGGTMALPVLETEDDGISKESLVILRYVEERWAEPRITREGLFGIAGYLYLTNTDRAKREEKREALLGHYRWLGRMLERHNPEGTWLFDRYGLGEVVYTPLMIRFWFLEHCEGFELPESRKFDRVRRWRGACLDHPAPQQVRYDQIVKLYYNYAVESANGALPEGRQRSSFVFEPDWRDRPMPPRDKYDRIASDAELGLLTA